MIKKAMLVVFDGLGDMPIQELGGKTPLEAAHTPNFDAIAKKSICGLSHTLGQAIRPGSDTAHLDIFGYDINQYYSGRGPVEVAGLGMKMQHGDVAFRGNMGTVDDEWNILDRRAGRITDTGPFAEIIDGMEIDGIKFILKKGTGHRVGIIMRGEGLSSAISDNDPHAPDLPVMQIIPKDDSKQAKFTADVLNKFMRKSYDILKDMPENKQRAEEGKLPANFILFRAGGMHLSPPDFNEKYEVRSACVAGAGMYKGVASYVGMDVIDVEGATGLPDTNVENKFIKAKELLNEYSFVFVHVKAADNLAEDGNWEGKKAFIEKSDIAAKQLLDLQDDTLLIVTADHTTSCELMAHTADPVPLMFCNRFMRIDDVEEFGERAFAKGGLGYIEGHDIMSYVMNSMGKLHIVGA